MSATRSDHPAAASGIASPSLVGRWIALLESVVPRRAWRGVLAFLVAWLTYLGLQPALYFGAQYQLAVVCGVVVALVADTPAAAALLGAAAFAAGAAVRLAYVWNLAAPPTPWLVLAGCAVLAAAVGAAARLLFVSYPRALPIALWVVVALFVCNMWISAYTFDSTSTYDLHLAERSPTVWQQLAGQLPAGLGNSDNAVYVAVVQRMRAGADFYSAFAAQMAQIHFNMSHAFNVRLPTAFWLWSSLPSPSWAVPVYLALSTLAVVSLPVAFRGIVRAPAVIPACAALAAYLLFSAVQLQVLTVEPWAGALAVLCFAACAISFRSDRWRLLVVTGAGCALLAALIREIEVIVLVAGLVSALWPSVQRRFRLATWGLATAAFVVLYSIHWVRVLPFLASKGGDMSLGSLADAYRALMFGWFVSSSASWVALLFVALGVLGAFALPGAELRSFAVATVLTSLVAFSLVTNRAHVGGVLINYWGALVVPVLLAVSPAAFRLVPVAAPARSLDSLSRRGHTPNAKR